ncbi:MAG: hypothetical protein IK127_04055 [Clostridia bacterium]|nr:hypothetical protein [Clostridia bacterium]
MKKLVSLLLMAAMMCALLVPAFAEYPDVVEGIDFGGATIYIYDYWSGDGARNENPNEEQAAQYAYRDWLEETYNCKLVQMQKGDWGSQITEFTNFVSAPDYSYYTLWIIEPGSVSAAMKQGYFASWNNDLIDLSEDKWNKATSDRMSKGGEVYGVYTGATEPRGMLYFNKKVLADAGIDYNTIYDMQKDGTWTWAAFEDLCKQLTYDADNDGVYDVYALIGSGDDFYMLSVVNNGGAMFSSVDGKLTPTMNSDVALEALNWAKSVWTTYGAPAPEGANWDWYKDAWKQGYCAFYMYQGYGGFNDNSEMADMADPWGAVMFPVGPSGDTYKHISSDNITVIPAIYDAETTAKLTFIYDMWTRPTPGFDDEYGWIGNKYNYTDARAVDETYAMMRENEHAVGNLCLNLGTQNDVLGQPLLWQLGGNDPASLIDANMASWQAMCDEFNAD